IIRLWQAHHSPVYGIDVSPNRNEIATCGGDGLVILSDSRVGRPVKMLQFPEAEKGFKASDRTPSKFEQPVLVQFVNSGLHLIIGHKEQRLLTDVRYRADGDALAAIGPGARDHPFLWWGNNPFQSPVRFPDAAWHAYAAFSFSPEGQLVALGGKDELQFRS